MSITFEKIVGLDKKSSSTDLNVQWAQELKNLITTSKPGALSKGGFYSDISSTLVSGALPATVDDIKAVEEHSLTNPSDTDIYIMHAQDSSNNDRLWYGKYWDGSAFQDGWQEITENLEGPLTCGASTDADKIVISDGETGFDSLSTTDGYYDGWTINVISGIATGVVVTSYTNDGTDATFNVITAALTGITASSDTFLLARSKAYMNEYVVADDIIRIARRENSLIGMTGNTNQYPDQVQVWFGYIDRTFGTGANAFAVNEFVLDMQQIPPPYDLLVGQDVVTSFAKLAGGSMTDATWQLRWCYVYDGTQIGPLNELQNVSATTSATDNSVRAIFSIPFRAAYDGSVQRITYGGSTVGLPADASSRNKYDKYLLSKRVTAIRIYLQQDAGDPTFAVEKIISSSNTDDIDFSMGADGMLDLTIDITEDPSGNTHLTDIGQNNLYPNYKYGTEISTHFLAADIRTRTGDVKNNNIIASVVDGAGVATPDNFGASNVINLGFYGSKTITGIHVLGDEGVDSSPKSRALVFTDDDYYVLNIVPGSSFSFSLDNVAEKEGLAAPDSLVYAEGGLFGVSRNGFRLYTPQGTKIIGEGLKPDFDTLTDPSEAVGGYHKTDRVVLFHFKTDGKTYAIDLLSEGFAMFEYNLSDTFAWVTGIRDGGLLAISSSKIYQFGTGTDQDGTAITPVLKTKRFSARDMRIGDDGDEIIFKEGIIKYKSDTAITLNIYLDNSGSPLTFNNLSLPAQTTENEVRFLFPKGSRGFEAEAEVTLSAAQAASNTSFEFNRLWLDGYKKRRYD